MALSLYEKRARLSNIHRPPNSVRCLASLKTLENSLLLLEPEAISQAQNYWIVLCTMSHSVSMMGCTVSLC